MNENEVSDEEISLIMPILQRLVFSDKEIRAKVQKMGVNVLPCNFYSNTPSIEEIESSFEYGLDDAPYFDGSLFNVDRFRETLEKLIEFSTEFNPSVDGEEDCQNFFWGNSQFSYSDAMSYYCFIRMLQPSTIIEIGAGFSTLIALEAVEKSNVGSIHCIEQFPSEFLKNENRIHLHCDKVQERQVEFFNDTLQDGDILFINSTHTVKCGSDCLHIYLRLLPKIRRNIFVHVHDVFLPFPMPKAWQIEHQLFWTEQYLLLAFLIDNPKASLVYGSAFNEKQFPKLMETFMDGKALAGGSSVWFKYRGSIKG